MKASLEYVSNIHTGLMISVIIALQHSLKNNEKLFNLSMVQYEMPLSKGQSITVRKINKNATWIFLHFLNYAFMTKSLYDGDELKFN